MPEVLIRKSIADLIRILEFLSKNRIEHKDIYPQNIFLRCSDENLDDGLPDFALGDFGWAKHAKDSAGEMILTCSTIASGRCAAPPLPTKKRSIILIWLMLSTCRESECSVSTAKPICQRRISSPSTPWSRLFCPTQSGRYVSCAARCRRAPSG